MTVGEKLDNFLTALDEADELYFTSGDEQQDLAQIENVIASQGYWAGAQHRFYFDEDLKATRVEERTFGNGNL